MKIVQLTVALLLLPILIFGQKPELGIPVGHSDVIETVALSPDGQFALSGSRDKTVKLWETKSGKLIRTWHPYRDIMGTVLVKSVAFAYTPKHQYALAASVGAKNPIVMWDITTGELIQTFTEKDTIDNLSEPSAFELAISPDGKYVLASTFMDVQHQKEVKGVKIWRIRDGELVHSFPVQNEEVESICFGEDEKEIWLGMKDGKVAKWRSRGIIPEAIYSIHESPVKTLCIREDGMLVSASKQKMIVFNPLDTTVISEEVIKDGVLEGNSVAIAPGGNALIYESDSVSLGRLDGESKLIQYKMKLMKFDSTKSVSVMSGHTQSINASCFSSDGKLALTGSHDRTMILWDVEKSEMIRQFGGFSKMLSEVIFSPDKKRLCLLPRFSNEFKVWNLEKGNEYGVLQGNKSEITTVEFFPNSTQILYGSEDKTLRIWDVLKEEITSKTMQVNAQITKTAISPDGEKVLVGMEDGTVELFDLKKGTSIKKLESHGAAIDALGWSNDGNTGFSGSRNRIVRVWDTKNGTKKRELKLPGIHWAPVAFAPDGKSFLSFSCQKFALESWNIETKAVDETYSLDEIPCGSTSDISYSPNGESFLLSSGFDIFYWKKGEEQPIKKMTGHTEWVNSVNISSDGQFGVSGGYDGQVNIWDLTNDSENPLAGIVMLNRSDWVIHTPSGLFDSSPNGFDLLYFLVDMELIELEQLKDRYWEPGFLPILMGLKGGSVRDVESLEFLPQYPIVDKLELDTSKNNLEIHLKKRTGGIGRVSLFINQKEVNPDINPRRSKSINEDLTPYLKYLPQGQFSTIGIQVYNEEGWLKSPVQELKYNLEMVAKSKGGDDITEEVEIDDDPFYEPKLRALVVGTSDYSGSEMDLTFADEDAKMITEALREAGRLLFKDGIHIQPFYSTSTNQSEVPSKANIKAAFEKLATEAHPKDVLFLFFSGHGMTIGEDFYYLTKDISSMKNLSSDKALQEKFAISSAEMMEWIRQIKANKQILVLDACHSGKAAELLSMGRSIASTQARALEQLKDRMGMYVLASSEANQKSFETAELGQGLLTYTILLGMKGGALNDEEPGRDKPLDVLNLLNYATKNVPDFAKGIVQKTQQPVLIIPKSSNSFPIGIINDDVNIPIPPKKSVIVNSVFMEETQFGDPIDLSTRMDQVIRDNTKPGLGNNKIFLNVKNYPGAYTIRGIYTTNGDNVSVKWRLFNGTETKGPFETSGRKNDPERLAEDILVKAFQVW